MTKSFTTGELGAGAPCLRAFDLRPDGSFRLPILNDQYQSNQIVITVSDDTGFRAALNDQLRKCHAQLLETSITHNRDGTTTYSLLVKMNNSVSQEDMISFLEKNSRVSSFNQTING